jgi:hypothetical protein
MALVGSKLAIKYFNFACPAETITSGWNVTGITLTALYPRKENTSQILSCILISKEGNGTIYCSILSLLG